MTRCYECDLGQHGLTVDEQNTRWLESEWRVGRKVGRTLYAMVDVEPSDADPLIGVMDTVELAAEVVAAHNFRMTS